MSAFPTLLANQRLIGFAMPDWMVSPVPHTTRPIAIPDSDPLAAWIPKDSNTHAADAAFQTLVDKSTEIEKRAGENIGKRGLSSQQYKELYWFDYLESLKPQEQKDLLWNVRTSPRYKLTMELYKSLPDKQSELAALTAEEIELFTRIDRFLAISIIIDISNELKKRKKQKHKLPPEQILDDVLTEKGTDHASLKSLFALAKKTPKYKTVQHTVAPLQKLL